MTELCQLQKPEESVKNGQQTSPISQTIDLPIQEIIAETQLMIEKLL